MKSNIKSTPSNYYSSNYSTSSSYNFNNSNFKTNNYITKENFYDNNTPVILNSGNIASQTDMFMDLYDRTYNRDYSLNEYREDRVNRERGIRENQYELDREYDNLVNNIDNIYLHYGIDPIERELLNNINQTYNSNNTNNTNKTRTSTNSNNRQSNNPNTNLNKRTTSNSINIQNSNNRERRNKREGESKLNLIIYLISTRTGTKARTKRRI